MPAYGSLLATIFLLLMLSPVLTTSLTGWAAERILAASILIAALFALGIRGARLLVPVPVLLAIAIAIAGSTGVPLGVVCPDRVTTPSTDASAHAAENAGTREA